MTAVRGSAALAPTATGSVYVEINANGSITYTCSTGSAGTSADGTTTGELGGASQTNAVSGGASDNADTRFGNGGNQVGRNSLFVSTQGAGLNGADWNAWASIDYQKYSNALTGSSLDFVGGVDKLLDDDTLVGVLLGVGRMDLSDGTNSSEQTSIAVGPYFAHRLDTMIIDGFVTFARPKYETTAGNFTSTRWSLGLSAAGEALPSAPFVAPYFDLVAFRENQPAYGAVAANSITSYTVSMGAEITALQPLGDSGLTPHMRVGLDAKSTQSTLAATDSFVYGRLGLGVSGQVGAGHMVVDIDYGKTRSDVFNTGLQMRWEFSF
ncbi:autotransporter domain-containing protein [Cognatishimia sp.]|uniref:autotransporter domain-containing protein n=1 Tax=Cognatishimia sp. TaxID=2211648 RepID=UPI0035171A8A